MRIWNRLFLSLMFVILVNGVKPTFAVQASNIVQPRIDLFDLMTTRSRLGLINRTCFGVPMQVRLGGKWAHQIHQVQKYRM